MALVSALRTWFVWTLVFSGIGAVSLFAVAIALKFLGQNLVAPLWIFPAVALTVGGLCAMPAALRGYRGTRIPGSKGAGNS
jgi:hypothetical protein